MHIVQTCHSDVKIHQRSEPIKPGAELNHLQLQFRRHSQASPSNPSGESLFPSQSTSELAWMRAWVPGGNSSRRAMPSPGSGRGLPGVPVPGAEPGLSTGGSSRAGSPGLRSASLGGRIPAPDFPGGCRGLSRPCAILLGCRPPRLPPPPPPPPPPPHVLPAGPSSRSGAARRASGAEPQRSGAQGSGRGCCGARRGRLGGAAAPASGLARPAPAAPARPHHAAAARLPAAPPVRAGRPQPAAAAGRRAPRQKLLRSAEALRRQGLQPERGAQPRDQR